MRFAARITPELLAAIEKLDDRSVPIAEVVRRVGATAHELGVARPSYPHVAAIVKRNRAREHTRCERRAALLALAAEMYADSTAGRVVDAYEVAARVAEINARAEVD